MTIPAAILDQDVPCAHCGYNLRTLAATGNCPECNHGIPDSIAFAAAQAATYQPIRLAPMAIGVAMLISVGVYYLLLMLIVPWLRVHLASQIAYLLVYLVPEVGLTMIAAICFAFIEVGPRRPRLYRYTMILLALACLLFGAYSVCEQFFLRTYILSARWYGVFTFLAIAKQCASFTWACVFVLLLAFKMSFIARQHRLPIFRVIILPVALVHCVNLLVMAVAITLRIADVFEPPRIVIVTARYVYEATTCVLLIGWAILLVRLYLSPIRRQMLQPPG